MGDGGWRRELGGALRQQLQPLPGLLVPVFALPFLFFAVRFCCDTRRRPGRNLLLSLLWFLLLNLAASLWSASYEPSPSFAINNNDNLILDHKDNQRQRTKAEEEQHQQLRLLQELRSSETLVVSLLLRWCWSLFRLLFVLLTGATVLIHWICLPNRGQYNLRNILLLLSLYAFLFFFYNALSFDQLYYFHELLPSPSSASPAPHPLLHLLQNLTLQRTVSAVVRWSILGLLHAGYWAAFVLAGFLFTMYEPCGYRGKPVSNQRWLSMPPNARMVTILANAAVLYATWWLMWGILGYCCA
ncbi:hypothetical protein QOT17_001157 [Balamuthia mandrillaris]